MRKYLFLITLFLCIGTSLGSAGDDYRIERERLIQAINSDARFASSVLGRSYIDKRVMVVMAKVPRHEFVQPHMKGLAYLNQPLPIGHGQTISQPFIVALMTDLLDVRPGDVILEIGTGSGYQAAVLAELVKKVYSIEIIEQLGVKAEKRLKRLGYKNVDVRVADGYFGWKEHAPFDGIIVTAAAGHVPPPLVKQLKPGGKIVIPVGGAYQVQMLIVVTKDASGELKTKQVIPVRFVPLTGKAQESR